MSESESTQIWDEEENSEVQSDAVFGEALASLEEHLQEHHEENELYDEESQEAVMYEDGVDFEPEASDADEPEASVFAEATEEEADLNPELETELEAALSETGDTAEFEDYPSFEEETELETEAAPEAEAEAPVAADNGNSASAGDETDDFNLATLTQLVDEIRHESQRVSEMKESVAKALSLIQEMSESLKS